MSRESKQSRSVRVREYDRERNFTNGNGRYGNGEAKTPRTDSGTPGGKHRVTKMYGHGRTDKALHKNGASTGDRNRQMEGKLPVLPRRITPEPSKRCVLVYVEGYEDVAFWRGIFDDFESPELTFEISVPPRKDLAKGKNVLMRMLPESSPELLLCVDSDFDYLFYDATPQSSAVNSSPYMLHTYTYAPENYLCYAPSLHNICVKATKNDARIFDFVKFMKEYSETIYPLFLWYAYSARLEHENVFTLTEFKISVKLNYLEVDDNGRNTLGWLKRQVGKRLEILERHHPEMKNELPAFEKLLAERGLTPPETYLFMHGHTLLDNVVIVMLNAVCEQLKFMSTTHVTASTKTGIALDNELSNYKNALRNVRETLLDNESYKECTFYKKLREDIEKFVSSLRN